MLQEVDKKYITLDDSTDFRKISKIMTELGYPLNHATARNHLINALKEIIEYIALELNVKITNEQIENLVQDQTIHDAFQDIIYLAYRRKLVK